MIIVYRLQEDLKHIELVQKATLSTTDFGIRQTHGLFGSKEWWAKIAAGDLQQHTLRGVISRVYMGSMGDWPEFKIKSADGAEESFTRECSRPEVADAFQEGRGVEIDYVWQKHKTALLGTTDTRVVLEIRISECAYRDSP